MRTWLAERCDIADSSAWTYRTDLHNDHSAWAVGNGYKPLGASKFYDRLEAAGYRQRKARNSRGFVGIRLINPGAVTQL